MKKWYKAHLDQLKKESHTGGSEKNRYILESQNSPRPPKAFRDPVAVGKRTRNKTFGA